MSEHASYHHGEAALAATIVGMAQDFVGSNNIPLMVRASLMNIRIRSLGHTRVVRRSRSSSRSLALAFIMPHRPHLITTPHHSLLYLTSQVPSGQFGTRLMGGKDAASARYIFTRLAPITRAIFHPDDDALLEYQDDDGQSIEPTFYMPIIPLALVGSARRDRWMRYYPPRTPTHRPTAFISICSSSSSPS